MTVDMAAEMGLYNFRARFVQAILDGRKTHTIRGVRKQPDKPGNTMHLYTGLRQKGARLLMRAPCIRVESIYIDERQQVYLGEEPVSSSNAGNAPREGSAIAARDEPSTAWLRLSTDECEAMALRDGFSSFADMMTFWEGRLPFHGHVYHWDPRKKVS